MNVELAAIVDRLKTATSPNSIYLFGSYARGTHTDESDYDFYIVVPNDAGDKIQLAQKAYFSLHGLKRRPCDIVVGYESTFANNSAPGTIEYEVKKEGILLYDIKNNTAVPACAIIEIY